MVALSNAPLVVTTGSEDNDPNNGVLSLREALAIAAGTPGEDTITFASNFSGVTLTSALVIASGQEVTIDGDRDGDGLADVMISGDFRSHHFTIEAGAKATLSGLVLANGRADGADGQGGSSGLPGNRGADGGYGVDSTSASENGGDGGRGETGRDGGYGQSGGSGAEAAGSIVNAGELTIQRSSFVANRAYGGDGGNGGDGGSGGDGGIGGRGGNGFFDYVPSPYGGSGHYSGYFTYVTNAGEGGDGGSSGDGAQGASAGSGGAAAGAILNRFGGSLQLVDAGFFDNIAGGGAGGVGGAGGNGGNGGDAGFSGGGSTRRLYGYGGDGGDGAYGGFGGNGGAAGAVVNYGDLAGGSSFFVVGGSEAGGAGGIGGGNGGGGSPGRYGYSYGRGPNGPSGDGGDGDSGPVVGGAASTGSGLIYLSAPSLTVAEGDGGTTSLTFYVSRMGGDEMPASVDWTLTPGGGLTAEDFVDGEALSGTIDFQAFDPNTVAVTLELKGDTVFEADESFTISLSNLVSLNDYFALGTSSLAGAALNDDSVSVVYADATRMTVVSRQLTAADAFAALGALTDGQAIEILAPDAVGRLTEVVNAENVTVFAGAGLRGTLTLDDGVRAITLAGETTLGVDGNNGNNLIKGSDGANRISAGAGDDRLEGGAGDDTLQGGDGADSLLGGVGFDTVHYSSSVQVSLDGTLVGTGQAEGDKFSFIENISGARDNDTLRGNAGKNVLSGDTGDDVLDGADGNDSLVGGFGLDTLIGGAGSDTLQGGDGDDVLEGGAGGDLLYGGAGVDTVDYSSSTGVEAYLDRSGRGTGDAEGDGYSLVENLRGSLTGDDTLIGNERGNRLEGQGGSDWLFGQDGNDILDGGDGSDILKGGGGADRLIGGAGDDLLWGSAGGDAMIGGVGSDTAFYGDEAVGVQVSLDGSLVATGGAAGDSFREVEGLVGSILGGDTLRGNAGNNALDGLAGDDRLEGGLGNDWLIGGEGDDTLTGGEGSDSFLFTADLPGAGVDEITDFSVVDDTVRLDDFVFAGLAKTGVFLAARSFTIGATAATADHRVIYNSATGGLFYDADGTGATTAVQFAQLAVGLTTMTNQDFIIV